MTRTRLALLSSFALLASGGLVFACSSGDDTTDSGPQDAAKQDSTTKDAATDTTTDSQTKDSSNDVTTAETGTDGSTDDGSTDDGSTDDASDAAIGDAGAVTTFMVLRVGGADDAGSEAGLSSASTQVFVEERNISDGSLVRTIDIPTASSGSNQPLTMSGSSTSEGHLTTSLDGKYVVLTGFATGTGVASVSSTSVFDGGTLRVIGRIDHAGTVDTTTLLMAFDRSDIRSAVTNDGTTFWASGSVGSIAADSGIDAQVYDLNGGVQYVALGSTGASTNITEVPFNTRVAGIFGNQLYVSSAVTPQNGVSAVGTGVPTTTGQTSALLTGFAGDSGGPYGFSMMDLDASVSGVDTLYLADEGSGIQKWVFDGATWTKIATFNNGNTAAGFRGLTVQQTSAGMVILATSTETKSNNVIKYVDDGSTTNPTGTVIASSPTNTAFRGIALAPQ